MDKSLAYRLQAEAYQAHKDGEHARALARYKKLLPAVQYLEDLGETGLPPGMSLQLCTRAIELETATLEGLPYLGE